MDATGITIGGSPVSVGDRVVYPNGGICKVKGIETKQIAGQAWKMLMLTREEDAATVMVPESKVGAIGLRKVATADAIVILFQFLSHSSTDPELDWKVRHRENGELMAAGGLLDTAQVLKGLHALAQIRPLPTKEREMYDSARHQLIGEISAGLNLPAAVAENNIDYALTPPPGSGRTAPKDLPLDIKALRRSMGGKRTSLDSDEDEEEGEGADIGLDAEVSEDKDEEKEETVEAAGEEEDDGAVKAKAPKAPEKPKAPKKAPAAKAAGPAPKPVEAPPPAPMVAPVAPVVEKVVAPVVEKLVVPVAEKVVAAPVVPPAPPVATAPPASKPVAPAPVAVAAPAKAPAKKAAAAKPAAKAKPVVKSKPLKAAPAKKVAKAPAKAKPAAKKGARK